MSLWTTIRNAVEGAASVAGNIILPGSSFITSQLTSKGAQNMLNSPLGTLAQLGTTFAGPIEGAFAGAESSAPGILNTAEGAAQGFWNALPSAGGVASKAGNFLRTITGMGSTGMGGGAAAGDTSGGAGGGGGPSWMQLAGMGLPLAGILAGQNKSLPGMSELKSMAGTAGGEAQNLLTAYGKGQLTPGQQAQVQAYQNQQTAALNDFYARAGLADSTMAAADRSNVAAQAMILSQQMLTQNLSSAMSLMNIAAPIYSNIASFNLKQDENLQAAMNNFATSFAYAFRQQSGQPQQTQGQVTTPEQAPLPQSPITDPNWHPTPLPWATPGINPTPAAGG